MITFASGPPTLTRNEQPDLFPTTSVAIQVTVVTPSGKLVPEAGEHTTITPGVLSVTAGGGWLGVGETVYLAGGNLATWKKA